MFRRANAGDPKRSNPHEHGLSGYAEIVQPGRASPKSSAVVHVLVALPACRPQAAPPPVRTRFTTWHRMIELRVRLSMPSNTKEKNALLIRGLDRKSTRLNSSHVRISYAVF